MLNRQKTLSTIFYNVDAKHRLKNASFQGSDFQGIEPRTTASTTAKKLSQLTRKTFDSLSMYRGPSSEKLKRGSKKPKFHDEQGKPDRQLFPKKKEAYGFDQLDESNKILISRPTTEFDINEALTTLRNLEAEQIMLEENLTHQKKHNIIRRQALDTKKMMFLNTVLRFESFVQELTRRFQKAKEQTTKVRLEMFSLQLQKKESEMEIENLKKLAVVRANQVVTDEVVKEFVTQACALSVNIKQPSALLARYDALRMNFEMQVKRYDELTTLQEELQTELAHVESQGQNEIANLGQQSDELKTRLLNIQNEVVKEQHQRELKDDLDSQDEVMYRTCKDAIRNMVYTLMQFRGYAHDRMGKATTLYRQLEELGQVMTFYQDIYQSYQEALQASIQRPKKHGIGISPSRLGDSAVSLESKSSMTQNGSSLQGSARNSFAE